LREQAVTQEGITGTISYMAPELLQGQASSEGSDLFSVGIVAYQLLTGRHPFKAPSLTLMMVNITKGDVDLDAPDVDPRLRPVLARLLTVDAAARYDDAQQVMVDLSAALGMQPPRESAAIRDSFLTAAKLVGRRGEMERLAEHLSKAIVGLGAGVLVGGESGVGKTRLLDELRTLALVKGALVLDGQEVRQGKSPYQVWRQPIRRLCLEIDLGDDAACDLLPLVPDLPELLGRELAPAEELDPVAAKKRLHRAVVRLFEDRTDPTVVLLEDLQWAGGESLELLAEIHGVAAQSPLLLLATYRVDEKPDLPGELPGFDSLQLHRLSPGATEELSATILGEAGRDPAVLDLLRRETEGNAFFIVEVARALAEEAGRLHGIELAEVPQRISTGGIQRILRRRLGRIPDAARPLLELAAVAGRELDLPLLRRIAAGLDDAPERLGPWLRVCVDAAVLEVQGDDWRFAHDKLRENVLAELESSESHRLHRLIGDGLVDLHGDAPEHLAAQAFHYRAAAAGGAPEVVEKAIDRLLLAGQQAVDGCLTSAALDVLGEARRLLDAQPVTQERLRREAALHNELGAAFLMSKGHAAVEVRDCFERSRALCEQLGDERGLLPVLLGLWRHHVVRGELEVARELAEHFVATAEAEGDPAFIVLADSALGTSLMYQGQTQRSWRHFERSIEHYAALPDDAKRRAAKAFSYGQNPGVANLVYGACDLWCLGHPDQALDRCRQGVALADQLRHPFSQAFAAVIAAWVHQFRREYELAGECALRAIELSKAQGFQLFLAVGSVLYGWSLAMQDQEARGIAMLEHTLDLLRQSGSELLRPYFLALLAEAKGRAGQLDDGRAAVAEAIEIADRSDQGQEVWPQELGAALP
ncbi:MAG: AAA family ATPase, partial [Acidobacteriota bacterium]